MTHWLHPCLCYIIPVGLLSSVGTALWQKYDRQDPSAPPQAERDNKYDLFVNESRISDTPVFETC